MSKVKVIFLYVSIETANWCRKIKEITKQTYKRMIDTIKKIIHKCKCKHTKDKGE